MYLIFFLNLNIDNPTDNTLKLMQYYKNYIQLDKKNKKPFIG